MVNNRTVPWQRIPCPKPGPEQQCIDAQDAGYSLPSEQSALEPLMSRLPPVEVKYLMLSMRGQSQYDIARACGVSQRAVCFRLARAMVRLSWLLGPGSWFAAEELRQAALGAGVTKVDAELAAHVWATTSQVHGSYDSIEVWRSVRRVRMALARAAWSGRLELTRYVLGLSELSCWGLETLRPRQKA